MSRRKICPKSTPNRRRRLNHLSHLRHFNHLRRQPPPPPPSKSRFREAQMVSTHTSSVTDQMAMATIHASPLSLSLQRCLCCVNTGLRFTKPSTSHWGHLCTAAATLVAVDSTVDRRMGGTKLRFQTDPPNHHHPDGVNEALLWLR